MARKKKKTKKYKRKQKKQNFKLSIAIAVLLGAFILAGLLSFCFKIGPFQSKAVSGSPLRNIEAEGKSTSILSDAEYTESDDESIPEVLNTNDKDASDEEVDTQKQVTSGEVDTSEHDVSIGFATQEPSVSGELDIQEQELDQETKEPYLPAITESPVQQEHSVPVVKEEESPFYYSSMYGFFSQRLTSEDTDENETFEYLNLPIFVAIRENNLERVRELCATEAELLGRLKYNPLIYAINEVKYEILNYLVSTRLFFVNFGHHNRASRYCPLSVAIRYPDPEIAYNLFTNLYSIKGSVFESNNYLRRYRDVRYNPLLDAIDVANLKIVQYLLSEHQHSYLLLHPEDEFPKNTAFHYAMKSCNEPIISLMLEKLRIAAKKKNESTRWEYRIGAKPYRPFEKLSPWEQHLDMLDHRNAEGITPIGLAKKLGCAIGHELIYNYTGIDG